MDDNAASWMTPLLALVGIVLLAGAVLLSAHGPSIPRPSGGVFEGSAGPSEAAQALDRGDTVLFGAWLGAWPTEENDRIDGFEEEVGTELEIVDIYLDWRTPFENVTYSIQHVTHKGAIPHLSWEPQGITTREIIDGNRTLTLRGGQTVTIDAYLTSMAEGVCQVSETTGDPVLIRPMHEMNGRWFAWSIGYKDSNGGFPNTNESYKQAWRKIDRAFEEACAEGGDVRLVFAVNHASLGKNTSYMGMYPGDQHVDYVGIDGYNWGGAADWGWSSFPDLFDHAYCQVSAKTDKPMFISEWGSVEKGGDKPGWISTALDRMANGTYPQIHAMIWLNDLKQEREIGGAVDWRVNSTQASADAYAAGIERVKTNWQPQIDATSPLCG